MPDDTDVRVVDETRAAEARRANELAEQGHLLRLWTLPGEGRALGLWRAHDMTQLQAILSSLPLDAWMTVDTTPLAVHPNDPALIRS